MLCHVGAQHKMGVHPKIVSGASCRTLCPQLQIRVGAYSGLVQSVYYLSAPHSIQQILVECSDFSVVFKMFYCLLDEKLI